MAIARDTTAEHIKPHIEVGAITQKYICGSTIAAGHVVALAPDGFIDSAQGTSVALAMVVGIAIKAGVITDTIDVCVWGPCTCVTGATPGALVYISDTAGTVSETAGTKTTIVGYNDTATRLFVRPQIVSLS